MTKRRKRVIWLFAAVTAVLLAAVFLLFSPIRTAFATRGDNDTWTEIGEIYNDSTKSFNEDNLNKLYGALKGEDSGTFDDVKSLTSDGSKTSDYFRNQNGGKNISVWFGGKKWDVVYLTTAQNSGTDTQKGDVILDLWQSADTVTTRAGFADWETTALITTTDLYPVNLYSASKMRVETLNAGGKYSTSDTDLTTHGQDAGNQYARFTMPKDKVANSLIEYIAKPSEVGYQKNEFNGDTAKSISNQSHHQGSGDGKYYLPNDAYGEPTGGSWYSQEFGELYTVKDSSRDDAAKYGAWQADYLWLPSITEVGCSADANGLWDTDISLRSSVTVNDSSSAWLRSGFCSPETYKSWDGGTNYGYMFVYVMGVNKDSANHADWTSHTTSMNLVRPALHLNLSAANNNSKSAWKKIGEIYNDGSKSFNADNIKALYTALTGEGSYSDVRLALNAGDKTSADFRAKNGGQNVQVTFGGIKWDAVYLTKAKNGDFILDLWQSDNKSLTSAQWADRANDYMINPDDAYPIIMYSTSKIRVQALNAGGYYSTGENTLVAEKQPQKNDNPYARFTMGGENSLIAYIAKPSEIGYQADEFDSATAQVYTGLFETSPAGNYYAPNDAYGTPSGGEWYSADVNYVGKGNPDYPETQYGAWQNDYLWLPSITETGLSDSGNGLWRTDYALRSLENNRSSAWLRSGVYDTDSLAGSPSAYVLDNLDGAFPIPAGLSAEMLQYLGKELGMSDLPLVRPAIHLNLTAVNNSLKEEVEVPVIASKTYTGGALKAVDVKSDDKYTASNNSNTEVGTYKVELTLKEPDDYKWKDKNPNEKSVTLQFEITTADNEWTGEGLQVDGGGWTYGDTGKLSAPSQFGAATYTYTHKDNENSQYYSAAPTAAGYYYVKATVPALKSTKDTSKNNYNELVSDPVRFEIKKATLTVSGAEVATKIYDGTTTATITEFTFDGYKYDDNNPSAINVAEYTAAYDSANVASSIKVKVTQITLGGTAAGNYTVDLTKPFETSGNIDKATANVTINTPQNATYNGEEQTATVTISVTDAPALTERDYEVSYQGEVETNQTPKNADTYTVTVTLVGNAAINYNAVGTTAVFTIKKAQLTKPTATDEATVEGIYSGLPYEISISGYAPDTMTAELSDSDKSSFESGKFTATQAGKYTLKITITYKNNYEWEEKASDPTFTINISKKELEKPAGSASGAYNGEEYVVTLANYDNTTMQTSPVPAGATFKEDGGTWKFSARDVGTYLITISLRYPDNYKWADEGADPEITISIGKTQLSFKLNESRKTYTGLRHTDIDVNFEGDYGHLTKDSDYTLSFEAIDGALDGGYPKGAGKYTVTLTLNGRAEQDYDLKVATATYEIVKADLTFTLINASGGYTGNKHEDIDVQFDGIKNGETFTKGTHYALSFAAQNDTTAQLDGTLPKTVGKYTVTVFLLGDRYTNYNVTTASRTYEINKAQITVSGEYVFSRAYNGEKYEQKITAAGEVNNLTVTMPVADPGFEITIATDKLAKTYTGKIKVEYDDVNFALTNDGTYTVTINKAELTLSLTVVGGGKIYDGNDTAKVTGAITAGIFGTDVVEIASIEAHYYGNANVGENKPIIVTAVNLGGAMADNYTVVIADLTAITGNIEKATVNVVWNGGEEINFTYDGNTKTITAEATGVSGEPVNLVISYVSNTPGVEFSYIPLNAGEYTATASTSNGNYNLSGDTITFTVAKQQVTAPTIASKVYNRAPQIADIETSALYEVTENGGGTVVDNYNVKLTLKDSKNYKWVKDGTEYETDYIDLIFPIIKATYDMSGVAFEDFSIIYDGKEHSIFIDGNLPFEEVTVIYENNGQTAVGEYTVTAIFTGDAHNYNAITPMTAKLTILRVSHNLSEIAFEDVTIKYDGEAHGIYIVGELPVNVTVAYEGNGQVDPAIYTITAIFSDPDGEFERKTATLTILRTQTQTAPPAADGSGSDGSVGEDNEGDANIPEVVIDSEDGFDPTLELVVEKVEDVERNYLAWGKDEVSQRYSVKLCKDGVEVPIEGKVTVRLLIPEAFRDKNFELMTVAKANAASAATSRGVKPTAAIIGVEGVTSVNFTRDGDYVVFEADGLSDYVFTSNYTPYFPIIIIATGVLIADVAAMIALAGAIKKKLYTKAR